MLMHHADPDIDGILRTGELHFLSVDQNLSAGGLIKPAEHVHHRTLACTVLSQDRMHLSFVHRQIDVVIRRKIAELFYDVLHLDHNGTLIHMTYSSHSPASFSICIYKFMPPAVFLPAAGF